MRTRTQIRALLSLLCLVAAYPFARAETAPANEFDERPVPVKAVAPVYPEAMQREGTSGIVTVKVLIDENGDVLERTVAKSTRAEFESAALNAVGKWKFKPARKAGAAVKARIMIPIKFTCES